MTLGAVPYFSIVIPAYNRARLLEDCLASVFAQRFSDHAPLIIDYDTTL